LSFGIVLIAGCGPIMRELQFANVRTGLFPMSMDLSMGHGKIDARKLMKAQTYAGFVERGNVIVHYPAGMSALAAGVAFVVDRAEAEIRERTGVTWAFKPTVYLVPVRDVSEGFRLRIPLRKGRALDLPMLMLPGGKPFPMPEWSRLIGHEITEASMLASLSRRELVLGDYCLWGSGLVNETRWFRDGVAEYAGDILNKHLFGGRYQPSPHIYGELSRVRDGLLDWHNCAAKVGPDACYLASLGLVQELVNRFGPDLIARIMTAASEERYINGSALMRAVRKVTGLDLAEFLRDYQTTWLGMDLRDTAAAPSVPFLTTERNAVKIARVYPGSPADKWKLRPGDVILSADDRPVLSAAWFAHYVASRQPRDRVAIEFERAGERRCCRMMVVARPRIQD